MQPRVSLISYFVFISVLLKYPILSTREEDPFTRLCVLFEGTDRQTDEIRGIDGLWKLMNTCPKINSSHTECEHVHMYNICKTYVMIYIN